MARPLRAAPPTLAEIVEDAVESSDSKQEAADKVLAAVRGDADLYGALLGPYEKTAALDAVGNALTRKRRAIMDTVKSHPGAESLATRAGALAQVNSTLFLDFPLPGGLPLGRATREEVEEAARHYLDTARDATEKGRWLKRIAEAMPPRGKKTVAEYLGEADLAKLRQE